MSKQKPYIFIIEVTAKSPKGIKALNSKHKGVGISDVSNARMVLEEQAIEDLKREYQLKYPGVPMQFSVKSTRIDQQFLIVVGVDPATQTEKENEQV